MTARRKITIYQHDFRGPGCCFECCNRCGRSCYEIVREGLGCISDAAAKERLEFTAAANAAAVQMERLRRAR